MTFCQGSGDLCVVLFVEKLRLRNEQIEHLKMLVITRIRSNRTQVLRRKRIGSIKKVALTDNSY